MNHNEGTIHSQNYIYIDNFDNVILESAFTIILGKIDVTYRFVPKSNLVIEQGLTAQMLMVIADLIKKKAGIGEKKAEPIKKEKEEKPKK
jgi:hypothetical protein